jgi:hypothetical protein
METKTVAIPPISPTICLSVATIIFLSTAIAVKLLGETLIEIGEASEEVFRGDRLPILHLSEERAEN